MSKGLLKAIIILPGTVVLFIPAVILVLTKESRFHCEMAVPDQLWFWLAFLSFAIGLILCSWTVALFMKFGEGTPAPWDPPKRLVIRGPYYHVRNPMITGVLFILLGEVLLFQSWILAVWLLLFYIGNMIYLPFIEEKALEKRFGDDYREYRAHVPRWIPRLLTWRKSGR
jgi:protein-S-isoprenylcysteine O-methyltransferase Ste14